MYNVIQADTKEQLREIINLRYLILRKPGCLKQSVIVSSVSFLISCIVKVYCFIDKPDIF